MTETAQAPDIPKPGTKKFIEFKALKCDDALELKKKIDKLTAKYRELTKELETIFEIDDKEFFSENGYVKLDKTNSYSIAEENLDKARKILVDQNLVIDDYITQKTTWGVTAKLRSLIKEEGNPLSSVVTIKQSQSIQVKAA